MKFFIIYLLTIFFIIYSINADQEKVHHGAPRSQFNDKHYTKDGHDPEQDHEAVLGKLF